MPTYNYQCDQQHVTTEVASMRCYRPVVPCGTCGQQAARIFTPPLLVKVAQDVRYTSPVTGQPITSHAARQEDMARHGAVEYDPCMTQDVERRRKESWDQFEAAVDQTVAEDIAKMPTAKRAQLAKEVVDMGLTTEAVRQTPSY